MWKLSFNRGALGFSVPGLIIARINFSNREVNSRCALVRDPWMKISVLEDPQMRLTHFAIDKHLVLQIGNTGPNCFSKGPRVIIVYRGVHSNWWRVDVAAKGLRKEGGAHRRFRSESG